MKTRRKGQKLNMNINRFVDNMIEQIKEAQLKLGFVKESIRLYFPVESMCSLLQIKCGSGEELLSVLNEEKRFEDTVLGKIGFSLSKGRIEVRVSPDGAAYVHDCVSDPPFLAEIIDLFQKKHSLTIEEICACFAQFGENYVCEKMAPDAEFDYVLYFLDGKPDPWYYCVRMEMGHTIYHRFTEEDYRSLIRLQNM